LTNLALLLYNTYAEKSKQGGKVMQKIICKKVYDTETSTLIKKVTFGEYGSPGGWEESLYQTESGNFFLYTNGGASSKYTKEDISALISKPKNEGEIGDWFTIKEQMLILENLEKTPIKYEILFYLMTGCRREEALNVTIDDINFENNTIFINGTKTKKAKRYVNISDKYAQILKAQFVNMFNKGKDYYTNTFQDYITSLGIKNKKLHDLRHTFSSNLFYLEVPDKKRQYLLGHSSISITNDIYTHLDPNIKKQDIINLYKDLYPEF